MTSPRMSTFTVGFAVTDFPREIYSLPTYGVDFSIVGRKKVSSLMDYTARLCGWFLLLFQKVFANTYPLPKLDMVVVPNYADSAMESWGLVVIEENYLLQESSITLTITMKVLANVMAEQLVHQWIGNLVTIKSWADTWLVEGLGSYLSAVAVDQYLPGWESLRGEITNSIISVMDFDSLQNSHAVS